MKANLYFLNQYSNIYVLNKRGNKDLICGILHVTLEIRN